MLVVQDLVRLLGGGRGEPPRRACLGPDGQVREKTAPADADGAAYGRVRVSHVCLNDDVVEGLRCLDVPAFSVQYHPEAAAGPHDSAYLFDRFCALMESHHA